METEITELDELGAEKVSGVATPANGTPWAVLKAAETGASQMDPESPHTESPEADAQESEMTKAEADEIEDMLTKASWGGFCGEEECAACKEKFGPLHDSLLKAKLKAKARAKLPKGAFALPDKRAYPIHDENHARAALSMLHNASPEEQAKIKAAVHRKYPGIEQSDAEKDADLGTRIVAALHDKLEKSPGVPDEATQTPKEKGHLATGLSGLAGPETAGVGPGESSPSLHPGGKSPYIIPAEAKINDHPPIPPLDDHAGKSWEIEVTEKANWITLDSQEPGSPQWEDFDATSLDSIARGLAEAKRAVNEIKNREMVEALQGDAHDWFDAFQLECAAEDICSALGLVATLAYHEAAEGSLGKSTRAAIDRINQATGNTSIKAGNPAKPSEEENIMTTVTKEELDAQIAESSAKAVKAALKAERKAQKQKDKARAAKNANNGGDITEQAMRGAVHGQHEANDVNSVPDGGHVDGQYVNKESKKDKKALKALTEQLASVSDVVTKMANRPQRGGPVLDGQARGAGFSPASEARLSETVTKSEDEVKIETLQKQLDDSNDPMVRDQVSRELTLARLRDAHMRGVI